MKKVEMKLKRVTDSIEMKFKREGEIIVPTELTETLEIIEYPTELQFESSDGNIVHPEDAIPGEISMSLDTYHHLVKILEDYTSMKIHTNREIGFEDNMTWDRHYED